MRDPQGYLLENHPEIRALYYFEYHREDGHPDFIYFRKKIEAQKLDERTRDVLIKQGLDRMESKWRARARHKIVDLEADTRTRMEYIESLETTTTSGNFHGHRFIVPREVYSNPLYREYLNHAETEKNVRVIVDEYYIKSPFSFREGDLEKPNKEDLEKPNKKKHWWQRGN